MILNNYFLLDGFQKSQMIPATGHNNYADVGVVNVLGQRVALYTTSNGHPIDGFNQNYVFISGLSVRVGTGTSDVSAMDYCLDNDVSSSMTNLTTNVTISSDNSNIIRQFVTSGINSTDSAITLTELLVTKKIYGFINGTWTSLPTEVAMVRYLLDDEIIVPASSGFTITFVWVQN